MQSPVDTATPDSAPRNLEKLKACSMSSLFRIGFKMGLFDLEEPKSAFGKMNADERAQFIYNALLEMDKQKGTTNMASGNAPQQAQLPHTAAPTPQGGPGGFAPPPGGFAPPPGGFGAPPSFGSPPGFPAGAPTGGFGQQGFAPPPGAAPQAVPAPTGFTPQGFPGGVPQQPGFQPPQGFPRAPGAPAPFGQGVPAPGAFVPPGAPKPAAPPGQPAPTGQQAGIPELVGLIQKTALQLNDMIDVQRKMSEQLAEVLRRAEGAGEVNAMTYWLLETLVISQLGEGAREWIQGQIAAKADAQLVASRLAGKQ